MNLWINPISYCISRNILYYISSHSFVTPRALRNHLSHESEVSLAFFSKGWSAGRHSNYRRISAYSQRRLSRAAKLRRVIKINIASRLRKAEGTGSRISWEGLRERASAQRDFRESVRPLSVQESRNAAGTFSYPAREAICDSPVLRKAGIIRGRFINFHPRD